MKDVLYEEHFTIFSLENSREQSTKFAELRLHYFYTIGTLDKSLRRSWMRSPVESRST